jgi:sigma-B regulation protein RsbU (phosphoserine phosphatase)
MHDIRCAEIWGGIQDEDQDLCTSGLTGALFSSSCRGGKGGDIYYLSVCGSDRLTRVAIADVVGHGDAVSRVSQWLYAALDARMNQLDDHRLLSDLNEVARERGLAAMTTASVLSFYLGDSRLRFSYAGAPPVLVRRAAEKVWRPAQIPPCDGSARNLPLAVLPDARYDEGSVALGSGDRLFLCTDGVLEAPDAQRRLFGEERLRAVLERQGDAGPGALKAAVLDALRSHTRGTLEHDDVTFMALEVR